MYVSDIENILKDHKDLYGANQRELSSLQLEIIYNKIRQCYLITLFLRTNVIYPRAKRYES